MLSTIQSQRPENVEKSILLETWTYQFYRAFERFLNLYYSKIMVSMIMILSIMSNTLFSLGYIFMLSNIMFKSNLFLDVISAREELLPILKSWVAPYIFFEMTIQMVYQLPLQIFDTSEATGTTLNFWKRMPEILGVQ